MSVATEPRPASAETVELACERCGSRLAEDQEWCLECGAARTLIHSPPDWRVPAAIVGLVALLVFCAFAIALINLSSNANRSAAAEASVTTTVTTTTTAPAQPRAAPALASWPPGLPGYTVVLGAAKSEPAARAVALRLHAAGISVGLLDSSQHPAMRPGRWIVFSGRFPTRSAAVIQASLDRSKGHHARVTLVGRAGA